MKPSTFFFLIIAMLMTNAACKKNSIRDYKPFDPNLNMRPMINAASNIFVWSPRYEAELKATYLDAEDDVTTVNWVKISGPGDIVLENKNLPTTKISGLEAGVYQFEITVTDKLNQFDRDTVSVTVADLLVSPNEIIIKNLVWTSPWYNVVELPGFFSNIPSDSKFTIFIQRDDDAEWKEVVPESENSSGTNVYDYFISQGSPGIYTEGSLYVSYAGGDISDFPDVKIVYQ